MDTKEFRNQDGSRRAILGRLKSHGRDGTTAAVILKRGLSAGGPWSEDLQDLLNEGLVESFDRCEKLSMKSRIRLAGSYK